MDGIINWRLASHPMNWVILFLMVFIAALALHFLLSAFARPASSEE